MITYSEDGSLAIGFSFFDEGKLYLMVHTGAGKLYLIVHFAGRTEGLDATTVPLLAAEGLDATTASLLAAEGLDATTASTSYGLRLISSKGLRHAAADEGVDD